MKYIFIEKHQAEFSIKAMCRVLRVAFTRSKQRYGAPRLTDELRAQECSMWMLTSNGIMSSA